MAEEELPVPSGDRRKSSLHDHASIILPDEENRNFRMMKASEVLRGLNVDQLELLDQIDFSDLLVTNLEGREKLHVNLIQQLVPPEKGFMRLVAGESGIVVIVKPQNVVTYATQEAFNNGDVRIHKANLYPHTDPVRLIAAVAREGQCAVFRLGPMAQRDRTTIQDLIPEIAGTPQAKRIDAPSATNTPRLEGPKHEFP